ncbi:MAG: LysR family transcriptional regulator [Alphaproteobacteria bacterium]|nr:LysR family transcriptional regulator [Alphaproteobacteria bacterium]
MKHIHMEQERRLPFIALRTFEAYARLGDVAAAAADLGITASAVSHQLNSLEAFLGRQLTERRGRRLVLTAEGRRYFEAVRPAFTLLRGATAQLRQDRLRRRVTISVLPLFASGWLIPRLPSFLAANPTIDIHVMYARHRNYASDVADLSVRFGTGEWPGYAAEKLLAGTMFPVCSPAFLARHGLIRSAADILARPLVHDGTPEEWTRWLDAAGAPPAGPLGGPVFEDGHLTRAAALADLGIALTRPSLVGQDLASGALVQVSRQGLDDGQDYFLCARADVELPPGARQLYAWLRGQAEDRRAAAPTAGRTGRR